MGEDSEMWRAYKARSQEKKKNNQHSSLQILNSKNIPYKLLSAASCHYKVGDYNYWPTTGKFYNQKTGERGRGVYKLIKKICKYQ